MKSKVALLFSGQVRTLELCTPSIRSVFPDCDVYAHAYGDENAPKAELLDPVRLVIEPQREMPERKEYTWQVSKWCYGVQGVLKQLWSLKRVYEIYANAGGAHEWVVRCRYDIQYDGKLENFMEWNCDIILPKHDNWWGYNDRFAILRKDKAANYFLRYNQLDTYINHGGEMHPESFLKYTCKEYSVCRTKLQVKTIRSNGNVDTPTYRLECGDVCE